MTARPRLSRVATAKIEKARRKFERQRLGRLFGRQVKAATRERYRVHCEQFLQWVRAEGLRMPRTVSEFDMLLGRYAEMLWQEGAAFPPALPGALPGWAEVAEPGLQVLGTKGGAAAQPLRRCWPCRTR